MGGGYNGPVEGDCQEKQKKGKKEAILPLLPPVSRSLLRHQDRPVGGGVEIEL